MGLMSPCAVSRSMEMLSSPPASSSDTTARVKPSLASSRTRFDCSVFLRISLICARVETLVRTALAEQQADLVDHHQLAGIGDGDGQASVFGLIQRHEVITEHQVNRDLLEQIVMQLEVMQIDELAAVAAGDVLGFGQIVHVGRGSQTGPAIAHRARLSVLFPLFSPFQICLQTPYQIPDLFDL